MGLPKAAEPLISRFSIAFTRPTFQRVTVLILGAIMAVRQRTVTGMLRAAGSLAKGHWSDFHRILSLRVWSNWPLGRVLATLILELAPPDQPVVLVVDDTTPQHKGKQVYGKGCHHDAVRSTHSHKVWVWGHKWVVRSTSSSRSPPGPGRCRCSARCTGPRNSTPRKAGGTRRPPIWPWGSSPR